LFEKNDFYKKIEVDFFSKTGFFEIRMTQTFQMFPLRLKPYSYGVAPGAFFYKKALLNQIDIH